MKALEHPLVAGWKQRSARTAAINPFTLLAENFQVYTESPPGTEQAPGAQLSFIPESGCT